MTDIIFTQGNLLEAEVEAVVNTVNTVGIMGKGIALMFKENYPKNFKAYEEACRHGQVQVGHMFVFENKELFGPKWIINFPTKQHWKADSKIEWITTGLDDLVRVILENNIRSIAIPPLGSGNGGLNWLEVRELIVAKLAHTPVKAIIYEPTAKYQNVVKRSGVEKLTIARALICEAIRKYCMLGNECSIIEIQKLAWFIEQSLIKFGLENVLKLEFSANKYGPYSEKLRHLLDSLDGSYLRCDKRLADATPIDRIWFLPEKAKRLDAFLNSEGKSFLPALWWTSKLIEGFESPLGMEALATVDWLLKVEGIGHHVNEVRAGISEWKGGATPEAKHQAALRKSKIFNDRLIEIAIEQLDHVEYLRPS